MDHNFETQRRDTYETIKLSKAVKLPNDGVVEL